MTPKDNEILKLILAELRSIRVNSPASSLGVDANLEAFVRRIVREELTSAQKNTELVSVSEFCKKHGINRITLWRAEKEGKVKVTRIGTRIFLNPNQFIG